MQTPPLHRGGFRWRGDDFAAFCDNEPESRGSSAPPGRPNPHRHRYVRLFSSARRSPSGAVLRGMRYRDKCLFCKTDFVLFQVGVA